MDSLEIRTLTNEELHKSTELVWRVFCEFEAVIAAIKAINIISGFVIQKKYAAVHSSMNKLTGALLFALPLTLRFVDLRYSAGAVCAIATCAAIQEWYIIRTRKDNNG